MALSNHRDTENTENGTAINSRGIIHCTAANFLHGFFPAGEHLRVTSLITNVRHLAGIGRPHAEERRSRPKETVCPSKPTKAW